MQKPVFVAVAVAAALLSGGARAADPLSPLVAEASPPLWTGFYLGASAGYGWSARGGASTASLPLFDAVATTANGFDPPNISAGGLTPGAAALANAGRAPLDPSGFVGGRPFRL